jgi:hypothetical protein
VSAELFIPYQPRAATLAIVDQANAIIDEYLARDLRLSLRQLFYQFVARALLENTFGQYKRLGSIIRAARDGGLIDWDAIEDRTREVHTHSCWDDPSDIIRSAAHSYREDLWSGQLYRPEVWIEKNALIGVIEAVCREFRVPYFATIGNNSQTLQYEAGKRFEGYVDQGLIPVVLHLADHDPNGIDMTRDVRERLALYTRTDVEVQRLALTMQQVAQYNPPENFAKEADTRFDAYVRQFGTNKCWELDALDPTVIGDLIRSEIEGLIQPRPWQEAHRREARGRRLLDSVATNWTKVEKLFARRR